MCLLVLVDGSALIYDNVYMWSMTIMSVVSRLLIFLKELISRQEMTQVVAAVRMMFRGNDHRWPTEKEGWLNLSVWMCTCLWSTILSFPQKCDLLPCNGVQWSMLWVSLNLSLKWVREICDAQQEPTEKQRKMGSVAGGIIEHTCTFSIAPLELYIFKKRQFFSVGAVLSTWTHGAAHSFWNNFFALYMMRDVLHTIMT